MTGQAGIDPWLVHWLALLEKRVGGRVVLEIGCGRGDDTATLCDAGFDVVAFDLSQSAVDEARSRAPRADISCQDLREEFPIEPGKVGAVVASLSLHYFPWEDTVDLVLRIRRQLPPDGLLLCRLNSTQDHQYGATGHPRIAENYYLVDRRPKRFFSETDVARLFGADWRRLSTKHLETLKYGAPKWLWEVVAEPASAARGGRDG